MAEDAWEWRGKDVEAGKSRPKVSAWGELAPR